MIPVETLAGLSGFTSRRLYQLSQEAKLPAIANGQVTMIEAIRALFAWLQRDAEALGAQKLKIATEQARRIKHSNDVTEKLYLLRSDVEREAAEAEAFYFEALDQLTRSAPRLAGLATMDVFREPRAMVKIIRQQSREKFATVTDPQPTP